MVVHCMHVTSIIECSCEGDREDQCLLNAWCRASLVGAYGMVPTVSIGMLLHWCRAYCIGMNRALASKGEERDTVPPWKEL